MLHIHFAYDAATGRMIADAVGPRGGRRRVDYDAAWIAVATGDAVDVTPGRPHVAPDPDLRGDGGHRRFRLTWDDGETVETDGPDFARANADAPDIVDRVKALHVGDTIVIGGGAAPRVQIERVA